MEEIKKQKRKEVFGSIQDMEISQEEEIRVVKRRWSTRKFCGSRRLRLLCALSIVPTTLDYIESAWPRRNDRPRKKHDNSRR